MDLEELELDEFMEVDEISDDDNIVIVPDGNDSLAEIEPNTNVDKLNDSNTAVKKASAENSSNSISQIPSTEDRENAQSIHSESKSKRSRSRSKQSRSHTKRSRSRVRRSRSRSRRSRSRRSRCRSRRSRSRSRRSRSQSRRSQSDSKKTKSRSRRSRSKRSTSKSRKSKRSRSRSTPLDQKIIISSSPKSQTNPECKSLRTDDQPQNPIADSKVVSNTGEDPKADNTTSCTAEINVGPNEIAGSEKELKASPEMAKSHKVKSTSSDRNEKKSTRLKSRRSRSKSQSRSKRSSRRSGRRKRYRSSSSSSSSSSSRSRTPKLKSSCDSKRRRVNSPLSDRKRHLGSREDPPLSTSIVIFGLPLTFKDADLANIIPPTDSTLSPTSASIITDRQSGISKGFGFINYDSEETAKSALSFLQTECEFVKTSCEITCRFSITHRAHSPTPNYYLGCKKTHAGLCNTQPTVNQK